MCVCVINERKASFDKGVISLILKRKGFLMFWTLVLRQKKIRVGR